MYKINLSKSELKILGMFFALQGLGIENFVKTIIQYKISNFKITHKRYKVQFVFLSASPTIVFTKCYRRDFRKTTVIT